MKIFHIHNSVNVWNQMNMCMAYDRALERARSYTQNTHEQKYT